MYLRNEHYLQYIKDQDEIALTTHVLKLQKENRRFVHQLERKQLGKIPSLTEKDCETIQRYRWYLEDTLLALKNLGSDYMFTKSEQKAFAFQKNVPKITRVGFYIGGYLGGIEKYEIEINEDEALMSYSLSDTHSVPPIIVMEPVRGGMLANVCDEAKDLFNNARPTMSVASWALRYETLGQDLDTEGRILIDENA